MSGPTKIAPPATRPWLTDAVADPFDKIDTDEIDTDKIDTESRQSGGWQLQHSYSGKVREIFTIEAPTEGRLALVSTDRISAFDHVLGSVPYRGQVLTQLSQLWFTELADVVASHYIDSPDPNVVIAKPCSTLPVEVVVRGYMTGVTDTSIWSRYERGERRIYGHSLPDGMAKNDRLSEPIITPTTKAQAGQHDQPIDVDEVATSGMVDGDLWGRVCDVSLELFARGAELASKAGLILVDTKYEFGLDSAGELNLIDEAHTPDSSRYWVTESLGARRSAGLEPENADKELLRLAYRDAGYDGKGPPPPIDDELAVALAGRYIDVYEALTGTEFVPGPYPVQPRVTEALTAYVSTLNRTTMDSAT